MPGVRREKAECRSRGYSWQRTAPGESEHARRRAEMIAGRFGAKIAVLTVIETKNRAGLELPADLDEDISAADSEILRTEKGRLTKLRTSLEKKGIQAEVRIRKGAPAEEIISAAQEQRADLIVMGKRGVTGWGGMLLGSTSAAVLREAQVPVLTVRLGTERPKVKAWS